jgi:hypothetical protein
LLEVRAPRPLLISSTTNDFFSIQGAMETCQEVKLAYKAFGKEDNAGQVIDDAGHGFNKNIVAIYAFFQKALELPGSPGEESFEGFDPEDLKVTATGQLATSLKGETAFSINEKETRRHIEKIKDSRNNINEHLSRVLTKAKELSGYIDHGSEVRSVFRGRYQRDGYAVEMYALYGNGNYVIPLLLFLPGTGGKFSSVIYINPKGKLADASAGGKIEQLVKNGFLVAAPDLLGTGEVKSANFFAQNWNISVLTGQSLVGVQAGDLIRVVNFLKGRKEVDYNKIGAIAFDEICPVLIHAAAIDKSINSITLVGSQTSYWSIAANKFYDVSLTNYYVAGALTAYDLPDLIGCIAPRKISLVELKDQMKQSAPTDFINSELLFPRLVYSSRNAPGNISIIPAAEDLSSVVKWGFEF